MRKITFCSFILIAAFSAHAQWADLGTASQTEVDHLCAAVPAPNGLTHDIYCAGDNPEILPSGAISTTGINVNGTATLTTISTSTVNLSGTLSTTALYVGGGEITGGGGTPNVLNPTECDIGEAPIWSTADNDFICPTDAALAFDFNSATDLFGITVSNVIQFNNLPPAGLNVSLASSAAVGAYVCITPIQLTCLTESIAQGTIGIDVTIFDTQYLMLAGTATSQTQSVSVTVDTTTDEWVIPDTGG